MGDAKMFGMLGILNAFQVTAFSTYDEFFIGM